MNKLTFRILSLLVIASFMLSACNLPAAVKGFSEGWNTVPNCTGSTQVDGKSVSFDVTPGSTAYYELDTATQNRDLKVVCSPEGELVGLPTIVIYSAGTNSDAEAPADTTSAPAENADTSLTVSTTKYEFVGTEWFRANVPYSDVVTIKPADPDSGMPSVVAHMFGPAGVLGADKLSDADANKSAVWTGSAVYHRAPDTAEFGFLGPEGSYSTIYAKQFGKIVLGDPKDPMFILSIPDCGPHCAQGILIRSPFAEDGKDNHLPIWVEDYGAIGAASFTRYAVEPNWARVFSEGYWTDQAKNALVFDNNGIGNKDTNVFIGHVIDVNDGSYTVLKYTASEGWTVLWTNVVGHASN